MQRRSKLKPSAPKKRKPSSKKAAVPALEGRFVRYDGKDFNDARIDFCIGLICKVRSKGIRKLETRRWDVEFSDQIWQLSETELKTKLLPESEGRCVVGDVWHICPEHNASYEDCCCDASA